MMKERIVAVLVLVPFLVPGKALAAAGPASALPSQAQFVRSIRIPDQTHEFALVYKTSHVYTGVVRQSGTTFSLIWKHRVAGLPSSLTAPGPAGLFQLLVPNARGASTALYAFYTGGKSVVSAIAGNSAGKLVGGEGIKVRNGALTVRNQDLKHQGSVRYRLLDRYVWSGNHYSPVAQRRVPDYPKNGYPTPNGMIRTATDNIILIRLEIASTDQQRQTGLMNRHQLDPDSGMIFTWPQDVQESFWMENTYVPLTVAFLDANGQILETQDMAPLTTNPHTPGGPYRYALEVNQGFFTANGIKIGDQVQLHLGSPSPVSLRTGRIL